MRADRSQTRKTSSSSLESRLRRALKATYEVTGLIGAGGMGNVYLATHKQLGNRTAIKVLAEELADNGAVVERFLNEAKIEANLHHPNIVRVFDVRKQAGLHFFVMDYVDGEDLADRVCRKTTGMPVFEVVNIAIQILRALQCAHENNIIHRDLKPSNVRIDKHGAITVMDFGIARARNAAVESQTLAGQTLGTPLYMSPEQIKGLTLDARSDLYSLGVILYEMLAASNPFAAETVHAIYANHLYSVPAQLTSIRNDVSPWLSSLVLKMLEKEPDRRYSSASVLIEEFSRLAESTIPSLAVPIGPTARSAAQNPPTIADMSADVPFDAKERGLLELVDGRRTLAQIQKMSELDTSEFYNNLVALEEKRVIQTKCEAQAAVEDACPGTDDSKASQSPGASSAVRTRDWLTRRTLLYLAGIVVLGVVAFVLLAPSSGRTGAAGGVTTGFDASPFAVVTVFDTSGRELARQGTPFSVSLRPGDYTADFVYLAQKRTRAIKVESNRRSVFREEFWETDEIRSLLRRYNQK